MLTKEQRGSVPVLIKYSDYLRLEHRLLYPKEPWNLVVKRLLDENDAIIHTVGMDAIPCRKETRNRLAELIRKLNDNGNLTREQKSELTEDLALNLMMDDYDARTTTT